MPSSPVPSKAAARTPAASSPTGQTPASGAAPAEGIEVPSFEQAIGELERLVARMESGELPLQEALAAYQRGAELVGHCRSSLEQVREQVKVLEAGLLRPLADDERSDA